MDAHHNSWDLETGKTDESRHVSGHETPASSTDYSSDLEKAERQCPEDSGSTVWKHCPISTQRDHFIAVINESSSVGLGLGSAVGIWACIHQCIGKATNGNAHITNWTAGLIMGCFLAPFLEKAARVLVAKAGPVLVKPTCPNAAARFIDHAITICAALLGLGICKGIQMQYGPLHSSLGFEYLVFVIGFTAYAFLRTIMFTIATRHDYDGEHIECAWTGVPSVVFWEYLGHFRRLCIVVSVILRDFLTFALYPYLLVMWISYWKTIDEEGRFIWLPEMLNIGFFFTFFSVCKETTWQIAQLC